LDLLSIVQVFFGAIQAMTSKDLTSKDSAMKYFYYFFWIVSERRKSGEGTHLTLGQVVLRTSSIGLKTLMICERRTKYLIYLTPASSKQVQQLFSPALMIHRTHYYYYYFSKFSIECNSRKFRLGILREKD
jgi:hypothetical protein